MGRELARRKKDLARYYVRLCGTQGPEGRLIVGDACRMDTPNAQHYLTPPDRDTIALGTFGGGEAFFRFQYDPATGRLTEFQFNAAL